MEVVGLSGATVITDGDKPLILFHVLIRVGVANERGFIKEEDLTDFPARLFPAIFAEDAQLGARGNLAGGGGVLCYLLGSCRRGQREFGGAVGIAQDRTEAALDFLD